MSWREHLPVLPVLLPVTTAVLLLALGDARRHAARTLALISTALGLLLALALLRQADTGALEVYRVGDWPAPFGIALVVDRLSALMLTLTSAVALPVLLYASAGWDARGRHFHALFQFQLMGLNGAFVTGDLFNLFVFFEVLLIASYVLMLHGLGHQRLRAGLHYVVLNLAASALFLIGVALIYAGTGTLNLADLALRVPRAAGTEALLLRAGGLILLAVFGFKAALVPLSLWLPATYSAASAPVAALFALMTKVGVYAIWRVHGVVFGAGAGDSALLAQPLLLPLALLTCGLGVAGALAARNLARLVAWLNVASVGTILAGLGLYGNDAWAAALYYLPGSTLVVALLFLLAELLGRQRGDAADALEPAPAVAQPALLGLLFLVAAVTIAGLPPLPGFLGKVMLMQAASGHAGAAGVWAVLLLMGLGSLLALARAGSVLFWQAHGAGTAARAPACGLAAVLWLLAAGVALSVGAGPVQRYTQAAAQQLGDVAGYAQAVLPEAGGASAHSTRPYTGIVKDREVHP
ncbi:monovalent cation/H+ antiporter subunit D [Azohydromonas caseinilytica]|uniref:Monovalent cation/H+ antiporter subunit D n=1 Tax=Azohydromonas caseinilytica TaxID=2728836 RepID=A0A848FKK6_9BURK|nr:monovalent cation/H+ antiporter subunit D [Azohydromonas caseinilytica]NML18331.1 monovalent cation/H+ antiporter subunit D [Azohydromonas caseinilytica]